ncbi:MAG: hypothetical protein AB8B99_21790 [Phormidesmis sp.]
MGAKLNKIGLFEPIKRQVNIRQKTVKDTPVEKLYDGFISLLCGAKGLVEVNKLVRSDRGLQRAFGRERCAEQSVIQQTLDASDAQNVKELEAAMDEIYQQHSQGYRHDYAKALQILDVDMSGQPCGPKAVFATKGYFAGKRNRKGRQLGRVLATRYDEVVVDRTYEGTVQLTKALQPLLQASEKTLKIEQSSEQRARTLIRVDSGGGSQADVNWMLARGYRILTKDYSTARAKKLAQSVTHWADDPMHPGRQVGLVTTANEKDYANPVVRIAVRCRKNNGQWAIGVLITNLSPDDLIGLGTLEAGLLNELPQQLWLAYVYCYDQRGGGVETSFKQDNQALGVKKRNKKRFEAQQMLTQLNALAHNVLVWAKRWLTTENDTVKPIGFVRLMRDVFTATGELFFDSAGRLCEIRLNEADTLIKPWVRSLSQLLKSQHVDVNLAET